jgi:hypothetical protein
MLDSLLDRRLSERLRQHWRRCEPAHLHRAMKAGRQTGHIDVEIVLAICRAFEWRCPFCGTSLDEIRRWHTIHIFGGIKSSGHILPLIGCPKCNQRLRHVEDDPDLFFDKFGSEEDREEFWNKFLAGAFASTSLKPPKNDDLICLADIALISLGQRLEQSADEIDARVGLC